MNLSKENIRFCLCEEKVSPKYFTQTQIHTYLTIFYFSDKIVLITYSKTLHS